MDNKRFDTWTRDRALRFSRRDGLRLAATGGAVKFASGSFESLAQTSCSFALHGEILAGPSASTTYDGSLIFGIGADGALSQATFTPDGGAPARASGSLSGRAFDLSIALSSEETLVLSGVADVSGPGCPAVLAGILCGPQPGDIGTWQATAGPAAATSNAVQASSSSQPSGGCPQGQMSCGGNCVSPCPSGQTLDQTSCTCTPNQAACGAEQSPCDFDFECCGGACRDGACTTCPGLLCGDMGCVDQMSDPNNCGTCGTVCGGDTPFCLGGACQCIPDGEPVGVSSSTCCSSFGYGPTGICGCAKFGEWCAGTGQCCDQGAAGAVCVDAGSGFEVCCKFSGTTCSSDAECCGTSCINGVCADNG